MNTHIDIDGDVPTTNYLRNDYVSEEYMLRKSLQLERAGLMQWGNKINEMTRVRLIATGAYSSVVRLIDSTFFKRFQNNIPNFLEFLRASDTFKNQIKQIAFDYDVDMSNLAKLIIQDAIEMEGYFESYAEIYYAIGALFYNEEEL